MFVADTDCRKRGIIIDGVLFCRGSRRLVFFAIGTGLATFSAVTSPIPTAVSATATVSTAIAAAILGIRFSQKDSNTRGGGIEFNRSNDSCERNDHPARESKRHSAHDDEGIFQCDMSRVRLLRIFRATSLYNQFYMSGHRMSSVMSLAGRFSAVLQTFVQSMPAYGLHAQ
ncbi:hypothetical protein [Rhizobium sp. GR12]|uniref:hypothetical protein n=1 Tax=Rhizobium sp. GR12 TaxID=3053925 RepID=UPI002FBEB45B